MLAGTVAVCGCRLATSVVVAQEADRATEVTPANRPPDRAAKSPIDLQRRALEALRDGDPQAATEAADALLRNWPDDVALLRTAADVYLRTGDFDRATQYFNRVVKQAPEQLPGLWQRGISLYFSGDYEEAAEQFEVHRTVNPNDVENAAWHFLCVAKAESFEQARRVVLPAPGDARIPMDEVLAMLTSGDTQSVTRRVESLPAGTARRASAEFYGDFYLGLYADARGDRQAAQNYLQRSAKDAPHHYMGDVARVYAEFLKKPSKTAEDSSAKQPPD
jgi:lipoprotein NlpI